MPYKDKERRRKYHETYNKGYYSEHKEEILMKNKEYNEEHKEECRVYRKDYNHAKYLESKVKVVEMLGGKCNRCGNVDIRVLQVNHVNGGGTKEFKDIGSGLYGNIIMGRRKIDDLNLLCANCNIIYEYEQGRRRI